MSKFAVIDKNSTAWFFNHADSFEVDENTDLWLYNKDIDETSGEAVGEDAIAVFRERTWEIIIDIDANVVSIKPNAGKEGGYL